MKNFILILIGLLLIIQCQKDDTNPTSDLTQPKQQFSKAELEKRALEIYNSQEYRDLMKNDFKIVKSRRIPGFPGRLGKMADEKLYEKRHLYFDIMEEKYPDFFTGLIDSILSEMIDSGKLEMIPLDGFEGTIFKYVPVKKNK